MARWLKVECLQYSHEGSFLILVDLLSGTGFGVDGGGVGPLAVPGMGRVGEAYSWWWGGIDFHASPGWSCGRCGVLLWCMGIYRRWIIG